MTPVRPKGIIEGVEGQETQISSRDMEHRVAVLRNGANTEIAREQWLRETVLMTDPTAEQAFEEGYQSALRRVDRAINELRKEVHSAT